MSRWILPTTVVVGALAAAAFQAAKQRPEPVEVLTPQGWFRVPEWGSTWTLNGFQAAGGRLFFLLRTGPTETPARSTVVVTDRHGVLLRHLDLSGARVEQFAVDDSGRIMARVRTVENDRKVVLMWDANGALQSTFQASGALGFHAGRPVAVRGTTLGFLDAPDRGGDIALSLPDDGPVSPLSLAFAQISGSQTAVISRLSGHMAIVDRGKLLKTVRLSAPEIDLAQKDAGSGELTFSSVATGSTGHIFAVIARFKREEGPVLLEFEASGDLLGRYRMAPAVLAELQSQTNPSGYSAPGDTVVVGDELLTLPRNGPRSLVIQYGLQSRK